MVVAAVAAEGLITAMNSLTNAFKEGFAFTDRAQKASLSLGMTFDTAQDKLGASMDGLRGSMEQRFAAAMMTLEAGMRGNTAGVAKLINQQQLTGTATAGTAKAFASLERVMGMNNEQMNSLATNLVDTGNAYGVSTDVLVNAINKLDGKMTQFNILGTEAIPGAVAGLTAQLGKPFEGRVNQIANLLFDTGADALQKQAVLGLTGFREQIQAAGNDQQAVQAILAEAIQTASDSVTNLAGGAGSTFESLDAVKGIVGDVGIEFVSVAEAYRTSSQIQNEASVSYADTIATQKAEVFLPLQKVAADLYTASFPALKVGLGMLTNGVEVVAGWFDKFYLKVGGINGIMESMKNVFQDVKSALQSTFEFFGVSMGDVTGAFGILWEAITDIVYNPITMFKAGLYGLQAALGQMVSWIGDWLDDDLKRWGDELRGSAEQKLETLREEFKEDKAKRTRIDNMTSEEIAKAADELRKKDMEYANNLTAKTEEVREGIEQVARNTATEDTKSRFQAESFTLLSESLDAIMGVSSSKTAELSDVVDALDIANAQRQEQIDKSGGATVEPM
jgi:hypothetical protein